MQATGADEIARRASAPAPVGGGLEVTLGATLSRIAASMQRQEDKAGRLYQLLHLVPIMGAFPQAQLPSGILDQADRYGPKDGFRWDVRRIAIDGFTAGTVSLYKNDTNSTKLASWSSPGEWTWSGSQWLAARDRFIFVASGITGSVTIDGHAIEVSEQILVDYLM